MNTLRVKAHLRELMPIGQLTLATPEIQRALDPEVVEKIVTFQRNHYTNHGSYLLMGNITIARINGNDCIIDGQHRAAAYNMLPNLNEVPVEIFEVDEDQLVQLYKVINSATPNTIAVLTVSDYKIINALEKWLVGTFPTFIKRTDRAIRPGVSMPRIRKALENRKLSALDLVTAARTLNDYYSQLSAAVFQEWGVTDVVKTLDLCAKKGGNSQRGLFFSLYKNYEWVDRMIDVANGIAPQNMQHVCCEKRVKIPKSLRTAVWGQPGLVGICRACKAALNFTDFECGHIVAVAHGGKTNLDNLAPICRPCNQDMGTMHMKDWIELLKSIRDNPS